MKRIIFKTIDTKNNDEVYQKVLREGTISFFINEFLIPVLAEKIAQAQWNKPEWSCNIRNLIYDENFK